MLILKIAFRNLFRHTRRTVLLFIMIFIGVALLFTANAIFARTMSGLKMSFIHSLTGTAVIAADEKNTVSIFGNEMPLVSDYEVIPPLPDYETLASYLDTVEDTVWTPVISCAVALELSDFRTIVNAFGIETDTYFEVCQNVRVVLGDTQMLKAGKNGILLNSVLTGQIERTLQRPLVIGEPLQLSIYANGDFRIRKGFFAGVQQYVNETLPFSKIILADPVLLRQLVGYSYSFGLESKTEIDAGEFEDLFSNTESDVVASESNQILLEDVERSLAQKTEIAVDNTHGWSLMLINSQINEKKITHMLNGFFKKINIPVKIMDWKTAAGLSAQMVFALQAAFGVGIFFIIIGAVLVVMNGLVISALERKSEIGTMRAIGAKKSFVRILFVTETVLLVISASVAGILAGIIICTIVVKNAIILDNNLLIMLFGGNVLLPQISLSLILQHLFASLCIASLAWIYPVHVALQIQPAAIMGQN